MYKLNHMVKCYAIFLMSYELLAFPCGEIIQLAMHMICFQNESVIFKKKPVMHSNIISNAFLYSLHFELKVNFL